MALTTADFYKSMTTYADHQTWLRLRSANGKRKTRKQNSPLPERSRRAGEVYLKLNVIDDVLIVSFKEL